MLLILIECNVPYSSLSRAFWPSVGWLLLIGWRLVNNELNFKSIQLLAIVSFWNNSQGKETWNHFKITQWRVTGLTCSESHHMCLQVVNQSKKQSPREGFGQANSIQTIHSLYIKGHRRWNKGRPILICIICARASVIFCNKHQA